jgi:hypothetical protein
MGPGGRLRPAPRAHRGPPRPDGTRPADAHGLGASSTGVLGAPDDQLLDEAVPVEHGHAALPGFDLDDEAVRAPAAGRVIAAELDAGHDDGPPDEPRARMSHQPGSGGQPRLDRRPPLPGNGRPGADRPAGERADRPERMERSAPTCTTPQLRRFIKSRAYVPMHELRRRFAIDGGDDDVTGVELESGLIFVGLPAQEGQLLGDLLRGGEVGFELSMDPRTPIVVGVYAMRPVPRP